MGVVLDTSAVIGWLERKNQRIVSAINELGEVPCVHVVTLGELHEGVARVRGGPGDIQRSRAATLRFVIDELDVARSPDGREAEVFGLVSARIGRRLSHNDRWILSRCVLDAHHLITEDDDLADAAESVALAEALAGHGLAPPPVTRAAGRAGG